MILFALLLWIAYYDIRQRRIPLCSILTGLLCWMGLSIYRFFYEDLTMEAWIRDLIVAFSVVAVCLLVRRIDDGYMGLGDVFLLGIFTLLSDRRWMFKSLMVTFFVFILYSLVLLGFGYSKKTTLPFAPFLLVGYGIVLVFSIRGVG